MIVVTNNHLNLNIAISDNIFYKPAKIYVPITDDQLIINYQEEYDKIISYSDKIKFLSNRVQEIESKFKDSGYSNMDLAERDFIKSMIFFKTGKREWFYDS